MDENSPPGRAAAVTAWWRGWVADIATAAGFLTRLSLRRGAAGPATDLAHALRAFPLIGAATGLVGGAAYWAADAAGLPRLAASVLALGVLALITGALHEDGLADCADALGAGRDRTRALAIMRDSRIGSFGVLALLLVTGVKAASLAGLDGVHGFAALVAAGAAARGLLALLAITLKPARADGLGASLAAVDDRVGVQALLLAVALPIVAAGLRPGLFAVACGALAVLVVRQQAQARIGGYTGDVFGAAEQLAETAMLLAFVAWW
jgi:adenosylcobinamide-GDP ribazoletransferase